MKRILLITMMMLAAAGAQAAWTNANTNTPPVRIPVMVDTNGVIVSPTNIPSDYVLVNRSYLDGLLADASGVTNQPAAATNLVESIEDIWRDLMGLATNDAVTFGSVGANTATVDRVMTPLITAGSGDDTLTLQCAAGDTIFVRDSTGNSVASYDDGLGWTLGRSGEYIDLGADLASGDLAHVFGAALLPTQYIAAIELREIPGLVVDGEDHLILTDGTNGVQSIRAWSDMQAFLSAPDALNARQELGVEIGVDVQAWDADLDDLADGTLSESRIDPAITRDSDLGTAGTADLQTTIDDSDTTAATPGAVQAYSDASIASYSNLLQGVSPDSLYSRYGFSDTDDTIADLSGNGVTATNYGGSLAGGIISFNDDTQRVSLAASQSTNISVAARVKFTNEDVEYKSIYAEYPHTTFNPPAGFSVKPSNGYIYTRVIDTNNNYDNLTADAGIVTGVWYDVCFVLAGREASIYVDGSQVGSQTLSYDRELVSEATIGGRKDGASWIDGDGFQVSRWAMWNRALGSNEASRVADYWVGEDVGSSDSVDGMDAVDFATAAQGATADSAVQPEDLGTAAYEDTNTFALASSLTNYIAKGTNTFTTTNLTTDLTLDCNTTNLSEVADVLGTLIRALQGEALP